MQLQTPTRPLGTVSAVPTRTPTLQVEEEVEEEGAGLNKILSGVGLAAALLVLTFQILMANVWINAEDNPNKALGWMQQLLK